MASQMLSLLTLCCVMLVCVSVVKPDAVPWTYDYKEANGPNNWGKTFPNCNGLMQSPIDLQTKDIVYSSTLDYFDLSDYKKTDGVVMELVNKEGHTAEVIYSGTPVYAKKGSLPDKYQVDQFHFHWGKTSDVGSEHTFEGVPYPMEMHIVHHQNHFGNVSYATNQPFGLAVLGFFFQIGEENVAFNKIINYFDQITNAGDSVTIETFALADLFPGVDNLDIYRYFGSLTTPPCSETVIWSLAKDPLTISEAQMEKFRGLRDSEDHQLVNDFRSTQALHNRQVTTTDKSEQSPDSSAANQGC